jgi:cytochrome c
MKNLYLKFKRMFVLLFSKEYVLIVNKGNDKFEIAHNCHCISCCTDFVDEALGILIEVEEDELDQEDAVDLANRIINNKN